MAGSSTRELFSIQTDCVSVTVKGPAFHPTLPGIEYSEMESSLTVRCDGEFDFSTEKEFSVDTERKTVSSCFARYQICPMFFEQQNYEIVIEPLEGHDAGFAHENPNIRNAVSVTGKVHKILSGIINFRNDIGYSDLIILVDGKEYLKITLEVYPTKIDYKDDYKALMADVTSELYSLIFDFLKKTYDSYDIGDREQTSAVEFFEIIREIYKEFMTAADIILAKPHHLLQSEYTVLPAHKVKRADNKSLRWIEKHSEYAVTGANGVAVEKALSVRKYVTYDTRENKLTKYILQNTVRRLESFKQMYGVLARESDRYVIENIDGMMRGIIRRCNTGFLREVTAMPSDSGMSLVFGMAPGYRELYRCYLMLQHGLSVTGDVFHMSTKDMAVLYEYWCFIKLNSILKERYELKSQDIIRTHNDGIFVSLVKGSRSQVKYAHPVTGEEIVLAYNKAYPRKGGTGDSEQTEELVSTVSQKPDNVLSLKKRDSGASQAQYEYVFDAKYRINTALLGSEYKNTYGSPGPQEDDINTMHRYRDAIVCADGNGYAARRMFGAYVLFPYKENDEYRKHPFYKSIDQVNIGGLPFLPSNTKMVEDFLDELVQDSAENAFERATLPVGTELKQQNWSFRDVLIGALSHKENLDIVRENRFYYTKKSNIGADRFPLRYVAIYQSKEQFRGDAGILYYGEIRSYKLVQRKDITEIPETKSNPTDEYYRFEIVEWKKLKRKITVRDSSVVSVRYTNLFLLEHCEYTDELYLRSEEEYRFYRAVVRKFGNGPEKDALSEDTEDNGTNRFVVAGKTYWFEDDELMTAEADGTQNCVKLKNDIRRKPGKVIRELFG